MKRIIDIHTVQRRRLQDIIIRNKVNLIYPILLVCFHRIAHVRSVGVQMQGQVYLISTPNRICRITDIILIELIITIPKQLVSNSLTLGIQHVHIKYHSFFQQTFGGILLQKISNLRIVDIIFQ